MTGAVVQSPFVESQLVVLETLFVIVVVQQAFGHQFDLNSYIPLVESKLHSSPAAAEKYDSQQKIFRWNYLEEITVRNKLEG